jgi:anthranilate phosphoribosyltransferase
MQKPGSPAQRLRRIKAEGSHAACSRRYVNRYSSRRLLVNTEGLILRYANENIPIDKTSTISKIALAETKHFAKTPSVPTTEPPQRSCDHSELLELFFLTRTPNSADEYFRALQALRPDRLMIEEIAALVNWVEQHKQRCPRIDYPHVNVFGTGGDGTVNLSSIAMMIASRFVNIVKVGTPGVTSRYGSFDFFSALSSCRNSASSSVSKSHFRLPPSSQYIPLATFGYPYNNVLRQARRRLHVANIPDIYKIVFPFANYTNPTIQINGASTRLYFELLVKLAQHFKRNTCVIHSTLGIDEIMPGSNSLFLYSDGQCRAEIINLPSIPRTLLMDLFHETESDTQSTRLLCELREGMAHPVFKETISMNAALYIACFKFVQKPFPTVLETLTGQFDRVFKALR